MELDHRHIADVLGSEIEMCRHCGEPMRVVFTPFGQATICDSTECRPPKLPQWESSDYQIPDLEVPCNGENNHADTK